MSAPRRPTLVGPDVPAAGAVDLIDTAAAGGVALRGGVLRAVGYAAGLVMALISAPLTIRHLGDVEFGRYTAVLAVIAIVGGLTEGGVNTVALRELAVAADQEARNRVMADLLGLRLMLSAGGVAVAVAFSAVAGYGTTLVAGTLLAGVGLLGSLVQTLLSSVLQSQLRYGWATVVDLLRQAMTVALIVALVLADAGVVWFLAATIPPAVVGGIGTALLVRGSVRLRPAFRPSRWVPLMKDTMVFAIAVAVNTLYFRLTLVLMSLVAVDAQTGYFAVSFRVMEVLVGLPALLLGAAFPIISRAATADRERFDQACARMFELALLVGAMTAVLLVLGAPFAIEVLAGSPHHPSTAILQIQSVGIVATFVAAATGFPLLSLHRNRETLLANLTSLVAAGVLTLALVPDMGAKGAAIGAVTAEFLLATVNTIALVRDGGPALPLSAIPVTAAIAALAAGAGAAIGVHPILQAAVGSGVFLVVLRVSGRFPPEAAELLLRRADPDPTAPSAAA